MAINTGGLQVHLGGFTGGQVLTQSTATVEQEILPKSGVVYIGMGTATGFGLNRYLLASTTGTATDDEIADGLECWLVATATGEAKIDVGGMASGRLEGLQVTTTSTSAAPAAVFASATGSFNLSGATDGSSDFLRFKRLGGQWMLTNSRGASLATATNS
jgi:hypothetical protein